MAVALSVEMLLFSLFLLPISVISQNNGRVAVGSSLTATTGDSSSWLSPSGDFAFGFSPLGNNDRFLLSIWYAKIPDKTVVWYAYDGNNPMVAPRGSVLNLTANSGLVLNNPQGGEIWKSEITLGTVANGVMNDTGNFVLQYQNSGSLWRPSAILQTPFCLDKQLREMGSFRVDNRRLTTQKGGSSCACKMMETSCSFPST
ncbi:hypothetical protein ACFX19_036589 [Malus domestica]